MPSPWWSGCTAIGPRRDRGPLPHRSPGCRRRGRRPHRAARRRGSGRRGRRPRPAAGPGCASRASARHPRVPRRRASCRARVGSTSSGQLPAQDEGTVSRRHPLSRARSGAPASTASDRCAGRTPRACGAGSSGARVPRSRARRDSCTERRSRSRPTSSRMASVAATASSNRRRSSPGESCAPLRYSQSLSASQSTPRQRALAPARAGRSEPSGPRREPCAPSPAEPSSMGPACSAPVPAQVPTMDHVSNRAV